METGRAAELPATPDDAGNERGGGAEADAETRLAVLAGLGGAAETAATAAGVAGAGASSTKSGREDRAADWGGGDRLAKAGLPRPSAFFEGDEALAGGVAAAAIASGDAGEATDC